jgi:chemotaxis protein CheX
VTPIRWMEEADEVRIGLPADLDLPMAQMLLDSLRHAFSTPRALRIEAEGVERVSTACVQILLAATQQATERGVVLVIVRPSAALSEICDDLGLADWLKQWSAS